MRHRIRWSVLLVVLGLVLAACGGGGPGGGGGRETAPRGYKASGTVTTPAGAPLEDVVVKAGEKTVETDAEGYWEFVELSGEQSISVAMGGYQMCPLAITVDGASVDNLFTAHTGANGPKGMAGAGDEDDPYVITNALQLQAMNEELTANYMLCHDIDASDTENWNDEAGFEPIGNLVLFSPSESEPFTGVLNGRGFEIRGLHIERPQENYVGLFGYVEDAEIRNVGLVGGSINGNNTVGGLVGLAYGVEITNSYNGNTVEGGIYVGGLVGEATLGSFSILSSHNRGDVKGRGTSVGGLIGAGAAYSGDTGLIEHSHNEGAIEGGLRVGGLGGNLEGTTVRDSYNTGTIVSVGPIDGEPYLVTEFGGLIGSMNGGVVEHSYNTGDVGPAKGMRGSSIGGLVGEGVGGSISNVDNSGNVHGSSSVGGVVGSMRAHTAQHLHNTGDVKGVVQDIIRNGREIRGLSGIGGVVGRQVGGMLSLSSNTGKVTAPLESYKIGGVVGELDTANAEAIVERSFNDGRVSGDSDVGGVAGFVQKDGLVRDSYNLGSVSGIHSTTGGVAGRIGSGGGFAAAEIHNSYNAGDVAPAERAGALVGSRSDPNRDLVVFSYFDSDKSGPSRSAGGEGRSTQAMMARATYNDWDDFDEMWTIAEGSDYPDLIDNPR